MDGIAIIDGHRVPLEKAAISVLDPGFTVGWAVFETLVSSGGVPDHLGDHLDRLEHSAREAAIPPFDRREVEREVHMAAQAVAGRARIRITLTPRPTRVIVAVPLDLERRHRPVTAARGVFREDPYLSGAVKHASRASWMTAVARAGVDEVLLVDGRGRFVEGTTSGVIAVIGGVVFTHPHDGRILESTTVRRLVERAEALDIPVRHEGPPAAGPWDGLYIASVSRHLAPVTLLDGERLSGWDPVGRRLAGLPAR
jgi:branched-chain amino acid aminotransferase